MINMILYIIWFILNLIALLAISAFGLICSADICLPNDPTPAPICATNPDATFADASAMVGDDGLCNDGSTCPTGTCADGSACQTIDMCGTMAVMQVLLGLGCIVMVSSRRVFFDSWFVAKTTT